jgi:hypothetical protein
MKILNEHKMQKIKGGEAYSLDEISLKIEKLGLNEFNPERFDFKLIEIEEPTDELRKALFDVTINNGCIGKHN